MFSVVRACARSLSCATQACPRSLPLRQTETINAVVWVTESVLIAGRIKWIVKKKMLGGAEKAMFKKRKALEDDAAKCAKTNKYYFKEDKRAHVNQRLKYSD